MPPVRALRPLWEAVISSKLGHQNRKDFCYTTHRLGALERVRKFNDTYMTPEASADKKAIG